MSKVIFTSLVVLMISSAMIILPAYATTTSPPKQDVFIKPITYPNGHSCIAGKECQSGYCNYATHVCSSSSSSPTAPLTTTVTPPNPACQAMKTLLTNSGYSATVIAKVMVDMSCKWK